MKIVNETPLSVEALVLPGPGDAPALVVIAKATCAIPSAGAAPLAARQRPVQFGDEPLGEDHLGAARIEGDVVAFKPRADVVLLGSAHAPGDEPVMVLDVTLRVGRMERTLRVFGDRSWRSGGRLHPPVPTVPVPFTTMDLTWKRAFGGLDLEGGGFCGRNPAGKGFLAPSRKLRERAEGVPLPNVEDPAHLVRTPDDHPAPAGFGSCGRAWAPRAALAGTYDEAWRRGRSPRPPADFRWEFHNGAAPELQVPWLDGDEEVELVHLAPAARTSFRLPGLRPRAAVRTGDPGGGGRGQLEEAAIPLRLDTLVLAPDEGWLTMTWRGLHALREPTGLEVAEVRLRLDPASQQD